MFVIYYTVRLDLSYMDSLNQYSGAFESQFCTVILRDDA